MSFKEAYGLWSGDLTAEYAQLLAALELTGIRPATSATPHFPVPFLISTVYIYASRSGEEE